MYAALKQCNLAGIRHAREGPQGLELVDMGFRELITAHGELLHGDELLAPALLHGVQRRRLPQSPHGGKGGISASSPLRTNRVASDS